MMAEMLERRQQKQEDQDPDQESMNVRQGPLSNQAGYQLYQGKKNGDQKSDRHGEHHDVRGIRIPGGKEFDILFQQVEYWLGDSQAAEGNEIKGVDKKIPPQRQSTSSGSAGFEDFPAGPHPEGTEYAVLVQWCHFPAGSCLRLNDPEVTFSTSLLIFVQNTLAANRDPKSAATRSCRR